jgi:hypothetical protein
MKFKFEKENRTKSIGFRVSEKDYKMLSDLAIEYKTNRGNIVAEMVRVCMQELRTPKP